MLQLKLPFATGETAYTIICHKIYAVKIKKIKIELQSGNYRRVEYEFDGGPTGFGSTEEKHLYPTKEDLIANL